MSREHNTGILTFYYIFEMTDSNRMHERQPRPFTWVALIAMAADVDAEIPQT